MVIDILEPSYLFDILSLEHFLDVRPRVMSRTDSRTGGSVKNSEADNQHQAAPRPPSRPTSADGTLSLSLFCLGHLSLCW